MDIFLNRKADSWLDVASRFRELIEKYRYDYQSMLDLVIQIKNSPYAAGLLPSSSMCWFYIAQSESGLSRFPRLRIEYLPNKKEFNFVYEDGCNDKKWWYRTVNADEGFDVLERFLLKRARWFTDHRTSKQRLS